MSMPVNTTPIVLPAMERCFAAWGARTCSHIFSVPILVNSCGDHRPPSSSVAVTFLAGAGGYSHPGAQPDDYLDHFRAAAHARWAALGRHAVRTRTRPRRSD